MAAKAVFVFCLITRMATMVTSVTASASEVSVNRGEQLHISCDVWYEDATNIAAVNWYRQGDLIRYGKLDVSTSCAQICGAYTADNRGKIRYEKSRNMSTLTLEIDNSTLGDNKQFTCGFFTKRGDGSLAQTATAIISVSVNYPQDEMNPVCFVSSPSVLTCSSEITQPLVSLEWTTSVNSSRISLLNDTVITGSQVNNIFYLHLDTLKIPYDNNIFTCYLTTEASPVFKGNCSIGPITVPSISWTGDTESTEASISTTREMDTFAAPSNPTVVDTRASQTSRRISQQGETQTSEPTQDTELSSARTDSLSPAGLTTPSPSTEVAQSTFTYTTWHKSPTETSTRHRTTISLSPFDEISPSIMPTDPAPLLGSTFFIALSAASGGVIIFLLVIVACLVSRRKTNKRDAINVSMSMATISGTAETGRLGTVYGHRYDDQRSSQRAGSNSYDMGENRPTSPVQLVAAYAVVPVPGLLQQPPPEYAVLDPDMSSEEVASDDDTYECVVEEKRRRRGLKEVAASDDAANFGHDAPQDSEDTEMAVAYAEIGQTTSSSSSVTPRGNDDHSKDDRGFVDNVLYMASSNDAIINEQRFGNSVFTSQKKVKGKPRLDPF
ncbi:uncharacterized protein LOC119744949 [Patiria miniata]|uniref:Ig-like domain-containing protein n=1 Tax=Patiria miniata TaxID=46514 RepID=A0A914BMD2_PATMI|nr:uncharacterized protein LOC119744949 [Patiria miniata]